MFRRKTKYHCKFHRAENGTWTISELELYGKDIKNLKDDSTEILNDLERKYPISNVIFNRKRSLHKPLGENETRSERVLQELKQKANTSKEEVIDPNI